MLAPTSQLYLYPIQTLGYCLKKLQFPDRMQLSCPGDFLKDVFYPKVSHKDYHHAVRRGGRIAGVFFLIGNHQLAIPNQQSGRPVAAPRQRPPARLVNLDGCALAAQDDRGSRLPAGLNLKR